MNTKSRSWLTWARLYGPLLFWILLIFTLSSTIASASQTSRVIEPILRFLSPSASAETLKQFHFFIRKCAHFTEYALLAFWATRAWRGTRSPVVRNYRFILAVVLVLIVASIDELNQSFEPSRTGTPWDVVLDLFGGVAMATLLKLLSLRKTSSRPIASSRA